MKKYWKKYIFEKKKLWRTCQHVQKAASWFRSTMFGISIWFGKQIQ